MRFGAFVARVVIQERGEADATADVVELARQLEARITAVSRHRSLTEPLRETASLEYLLLAAEASTGACPYAARYLRSRYTSRAGQKTALGAARR